jgi:hypothetical protein
MMNNLANIVFPQFLLPFLFSIPLKLLFFVISTD